MAQSSLKSISDLDKNCLFFLALGVCPTDYFKQLNANSQNSICKFIHSETTRESYRKSAEHMGYSAEKAAYIYFDKILFEVKTRVEEIQSRLYFSLWDGSEAKKLLIELETLSVHIGKLLESVERLCHEDRINEAWMDLEKVINLLEIKKEKQVCIFQQDLCVCIEKT